MVRIVRVVIPDIPHHIIQRGNRSQNVFFNNQDKEFYLNTLRTYAKQAGITFWAYCLMDNHVHLIAVPDREDSLAKGLGEAHRRYTRMVNFREGWRGYLWQGRFNSYPLEERHLYAAIRYVESNPVRAGIVEKAEDYPYSSALAHVHKTKDVLLASNFMLSEIEDWAAYLSQADQQTDSALFRKHAAVGRPLGSKDFIARLERITGRRLRKGRPGPKGNKKNN